MYISKYSASGNDFVIFHTFVKKDRSDLAKVLCNRFESVGADGLIVLLPHSEYDFEWQFYNADGSIAMMCGNGSRAAAHYAFENDISPSKMKFLTGAGVIGASVEDNMVQSDLTPPVIHEKSIDAFSKDWWLIDTGVPHLITFLDDINDFNLVEARELRERYNANVNIATIKDGRIYVRTYERGVEDETQACGTGMAAAFYRAVEENLCGQSVEVIPSSGETLYLGMSMHTITFKGSVRKTFETIVD